MASSRKKLDEYSEEKLIAVAYSSQPLKPKPKTYKRYFVQTDCERLYVMTTQVSKTATQIAMLMLRDMNHYTNMYTGTYKEVQQELGLSNRPVIEAMGELQKVDFMRKHHNSRYMVNPTIAIGCSEDYLPKLLDDYHAIKTYTPRKDGEIKDVDR